MIKVISKGYILTCKSWEGDRDAYRINALIVDTKEEALALRELCLLCTDGTNNGGQTIGNTDEDGLSNEQIDMIINFMKKNPCLVENNSDNLLNVFMTYNYRLLGRSEYNYSRVFESMIIAYSPNDIFLEEIE